MLAALPLAACGGRLAATGDPAALYTAYCQRCHGSDGRGDPRTVQLNPNVDLVRGEVLATGDREKIFGRIARGYGPMPGFAHKLDPKDIQALVDFCLKLHRQAS